MTTTIQPWPNRLGVDVGDPDGDGAEIWFLHDGAWAVRTFAGGVGERYLRIDPRDFLIAPDYIEAAALCRAHGRECQ